MRFIPSRVHGLLDYVVGIFLIYVPRLFGFQDGGPEERVFVILGVAALAYSVVTRYESGVIRVLPFRGHLVLDFVSGVILASSPWVFGFADRVWMPHVLLGLLEMVVPLCTVPRPFSHTVTRVPLR